jgi:ElaB/YqjD/DUF883 family membrane-anchored ribosome-binding protein
MDYSNKEPEEIRSEIDRTRTAISHTVDEIQERLSPARLKEEATQAVREATIGKVERMTNMASRTVSEYSSGVLNTIRRNPVPAALMGLGLGWLIIESARTTGTGYYRTYEPYGVEGYGSYGTQSKVKTMAGEAREAVGRAGEKAGEMASEAVNRVENIGSQALGQVENVGSQVVDQAEYLRDRAEYQARQAASRFDQMLQDNPLAVGVAALAVGAAIGLAVPNTEPENRLLGETRDNLMDRARDMAEDTAHKVQRVAESAQQAAKDAAKEEARNQEFVKEPDEP